MVILKDLTVAWWIMQDQEINPEELQRTFLQMEVIWLFNYLK